MGDTLPECLLARRLFVGARFVAIASARCAATVSNVCSSWAAYPFTALTRFGMRS